MGILMETSEVRLGTGRVGCRTQAEVFAMGASRELYSETLHTIALSTRETEIGSVIQPIPVTPKTYKQLPLHGRGYAFQANSAVSALSSAPRLPDHGPSTSAALPSPVKQVNDTSKITRAPPKKKWIREYLEEEPKSPVSVRVVSVARSNGVVRPPSPVAAPADPPAPVPPLTAAPPPALVLDFAQEHSRPRTTSTNSHGPPQVPSPPSVGSSGSGSSGSTPRAGTREVHNKLEKNRRAHLKECFELLKRQLPATSDDKKTSNLSILGSAIRYIQVLRRKERECEHEMERLAREKIAAQQRLAALKREVAARLPARPRPLEASTSSAICAPEAVSEDKDMEERVNGHVLGTSSSSSSPRSPPHSLNLSTKLRTLPIQITPTTSQQVIRTSYGARHNTLTLTTLAPADALPQPNGVIENGVTNALSTLVHPAQIHLPISQVVSTGGLVVSPATLQLLSAGAGLRVLPARPNGVTTGENNRISRTENVIVPSTPSSSTEGSGVISRSLAPLVVSQPAAAHLLHTHTLTHNIVESQLVKNSVSPLTVSAQYLSTTIVKPVVVVSSAHTT